MFHGPSSHFGAVANWHEARDDTFINPFPRKMKKRDETRPRDRTLDDNEIRALWAATSNLEQPFSRMVRFLLLTATRRDEAGAMRWQEVQGDTWTIPAERYKTSHVNGRDVEIPLSGAARAVLTAMPKIGTEDWVFTAGGDACLGGFSRRKKGWTSLCSPAFARRRQRAATIPRRSNWAAGRSTTFGAQRARS
jgi:integrase